MNQFRLGKTIHVPGRDVRIRHMDQFALKCYAFHSLNAGIREEIMNE